ncbi:UNVERIFIED_ORG: hypothetical protein J2Y81_002987 [Paraburkholderia sediminicola]|nr:hypothetical protein [Paraburkholderia sediminicola]
MDTKSHSKRDLIFFAVVAAAFLAAIRLRLGAQLPDDAAFFLRYAENMAHGEFWIWNPGEKPVWGASAPFFAVLLALPIRLGFEPALSLTVISAAMSVLSLAYTATLLLKRFGYAVATAFVVFMALNTSAMFYAANGLETPLTFVLLTFALHCILEKRGDTAIGIAAGLLMIHKLDLVPVGVLLLGAHAIQDGRLRVPVRSLALSVAIALVWYLFAWVYFGAPVPNSFLTKALHQGDLPNRIGSGWFSQLVLWGAGQWLISLFALVAVLRHGRQRIPLLIFAVGTLAIHAAAYTVKHPFEPYDWYGMPSIYVLYVLGSIGAVETADTVNQWLQRPRLLSTGVLVALILLLTISRQEKPQMARAQTYKEFLEYQERDRTDAGKWVDANTPSSFRVLTMWGNPAYFSHRYVYDASFLNRKYESGSLLEKYHPEIMILENQPGTTPMTPYNYSDDYVPVKIFDRTFASIGNYFYIVYARKDVVPQLKGVVFPVQTSCHSLSDCQRYLPLAPQAVTEGTSAGFATVQINGPGYCSVDTLNDQPYEGNPVISAKDPLKLTGWALDRQAVKLPDSVYIRLESATGRSYFAPAKLRLPRPDVPAGLKLPSAMEDAGFVANMGLELLTAGEYKVSVVIQSGSHGFTCAAGRVTVASR